MIEKEKLDRINALARKKKTVGLTEEETKEQAILREEYLAAFRADFIGIMENVRVVEPDGTVIKPERRVH